MTYTINQWFGRLGNNIQQISNAIYYCKNNKINFYSPKHSLININNINFGIDKPISNRFFFYSTKEKDFDVDTIDLNAKRKKICEEYITPNFNFFIDQPFDDNFVIIHIRGGDVFSSNPPNTYVQNALDFYVNIIKKFEFAIIVAEDSTNIIVKELKKFNNVLIQSTTLQNDFATLMRAKHLVTSGVGTFAMSAALCSKNLTDFYCSDVHLEEHLNYKMLLDTNIRIHLNRIQNYIKIGDWKNTLEQQKLMLEYKL